MKRLILFALVFGIPIWSFSQTFAVEARDDRSKATIEDKLKFDGYKVATLNEPYDYKIELLVDGQYAPISFKHTHHGYITISDKQGKMIGRSKEERGSPATVNGYNASNVIAKKILKKQLPGMLSMLK
jgi:hypothetical protein